jgi:hypothetical protein
MINEIRINGNTLVSVEKRGKEKFWIFKNFEIKNLDLKIFLIEIKCKGLDHWETRKCFQFVWLKKPYFSKKYYAQTNNPFKGKKHSKELKERLSKERKGIWGIGENNPMYGKSVYSVWLKKYGEKKQIYYGKII